MTTAKPLSVAILYVQCNMCGSITDCKSFEKLHNYICIDFLNDLLRLLSAD